MNLPVPKINVQLLETVKRPLRPPRARDKLKKSAENVTDWFDWLKKSGESFVNKTSEKWQKLKKSVMSFFGEDFPIRKEKVLCKILLDNM